MLRIESIAFICREIEETARKSEMYLQNLISSRIKDLQELKTVCDRCLNSQRWSGNVSLMILDAAFTSVGVNYFQVVVAKVKAFEAEFVKTGRISSLSCLAHFDYKEAFHIWKNSRSWNVVKEIAKYFSELSNNDKESLRTWAKNSSLADWKNDPIGKIKGVGLVTYQYLRMMGGIDTVMPDKVVKKVINEILTKAGKMTVYDDMEFIREVETLANKTGYRPIELCFMAWFTENSEKIEQMP
ncbi:hypothetical protein V4D30_02085 [Thermodesulfovibrio sp. 3907-1M]|uniref:Uncharacterized protein n=1 Tax=Thermodesulfovibrio autotrophicus TaxID=3118333 RepID=A0AAU8GWV4_9BACT